MIRRLVAFATLAALLAACTQSGPSSGSGQASRGTSSGILRVAIQQDVKNLNPLLNSNTTDGMIGFLMFLPLLHANAQGEPVPMLAAQVPTLENGGISKDGLTITYHLRKNVKWSDGVPVTSKDVKWSWQAIMNKNNNIISNHGYDYVKSIDIPDDYTVVVHLKQKFSPFVNTFFADSDQPYPVAPAHILSKYPNINNIPFNSNPTVGDGPFKFVRWVHGDHIELTANDDFFMGKPGLRGIYIRIVPDENTTINLLRTHDIDWMFEASINNYPLVKDIKGVKLVWVDVNGYEDIQLNVQRPYLQDVRVRQAVAYALNKARIVQTSTFGQDKIAIEDQPPFMWSYDPNIKDYPYDVQKAKQLLQQAGWTPGPSGIMTKGGQPLTLVLVSNNSNVTRRKNSVVIQEMLRQAGIQVDIKYFPGDVLFAPVGEGGILQGGKFDLSLAGWYAGIDPDDASQFMCANMAPNGYNYSRYCSQAMDAAQKTALENYDRPTRKKAYSQIQQLLHNDVPEIFTYYQRQMQPINENFKGFAPNPVTESWNAWQWSI
ncbi:MAG TPA: peptide ABC transporter substrate-binding protein [Candidatus Baltobacteraceae bacterium]|nr:peptide ABC transporter substrate-binding protein [Candidatus Baltobacteraceae bacterium]